MHMIRMILPIGLLFFSACKNDGIKSKVKEFEFSVDICRDLQQAVDKRWNSSLGMSRAAYHSKLVSQETSIIAYELPRYKRRMEEIRSNSGPANGPTGNEKPLPVGTSTSPQPSSSTSKINSQREDSATSGQAGLSLSTSSAGGSASNAHEVCPGCDKATIAKKLAALEKNQSSISGCVYRDPANSQNSTSDIDPDQGLSAKEKEERAAAVKQMKSLIYAATQPKELCDWFARWSAGTGASRDRCKRETVEVFCKGIVDVGGNIAVDTINGNVSGSGVGNHIVKPIPGYVKDVMIACSQQWAYEKMKDALREGTFSGLSSAIRDQAKDAITGDQLGPVSQEKKIAELKKNIALAVCKAGAGLIASQIDESPQINYDNPCAAIWAASKSRAKACLNTTASGCKIAAGDIDIRNFFPAGITDDRPLATLTAEAVNTIAGMGCKSAGKVGTAACATISEAASQIRSALLTGNNDWAHCLGTDQAGACAGTVAAEYWLGIKVSDLGQPIRPAQPIPGEPSVLVRDYCVCDLGCYEDDWGTDTQVARGRLAKTISANDAGTRDCKRLEGRWVWSNELTGYKKSSNGFYLYWKSNNCQIRRIKNVSHTGKDNMIMLGEVETGSGWARQSHYSIGEMICLQ